MSTQNKGGLLASLTMLAGELGAEKTASAQKQAETPTPDDPGGYQGASTHPTTSVDNRGQGATEGSRSSENSSDVKEDQGKLSVDSTPENVVGSQDEVQLNIGTEAKATGEAPGVEDDFKGGKDDPGSTHAARTDNNSLDGHKYASASTDDLVKFTSDLHNSVLADLAVGRGSELTKEAMDAAASDAGLNPAAAGEEKPKQPKMQGAGDAPSGEPVAGEGTKMAEATDTGEKTNAQPVVSDSTLDGLIKQAHAAVDAGQLEGTAVQSNRELAAGYEVADQLGVEKTAAQQFVAGNVEATIQDAFVDADLLGTYLWASKKAMETEDEASGEDHNGPGDDSSGASATDGVSGEGEGDDSPSPVPGDAGGAPDAGGGPEGGSGDPIAEMLGGGGGESLGDALGGGGDPGGMMPPPGGPEGGDPMGMGGGGQEAAIMQLVAALDELGIPLEELAGAGGGDPMGGGMPPEAGGGMPPEAGGAPPMGEGMKLASVVKAFKRSGKYRFKEAADGTPERQLRDQLKTHVLELLGS